MIKTSDVKRKSIIATIKFHPHGNMTIPASGMNANESCCNGRCQKVLDNSIPVSVSKEYL